MGMLLVTLGALTLVHGDHLVVGQDVVRLLRHVPHVAADDEWRLHTFIGKARTSSDKISNWPQMLCLYCTKMQREAESRYVRLQSHLGDRPEAEVHDVLAVGHAPVAHLQHVRICKTTGVCIYNYKATERPSSI